ncbi:MAG: CBS domain-containing protein [Anaerolineae bacterium]|jgi:CBS domain-containing protein|nr:CBS domain-containing protein [Anaerolineae bacterium]
MNKIRDLLRYKPQSVWTIRPDATVYEALELMAEKNIGAVPVIENDALIGIFSERDYARKCILMGRHSKETLVSELMSSPVVTIDSDFTIEQCLALMTERQFRHLPVIEGDTLTGIVSIGDIGKWVISEQRSMIRDLEGFITGNNYGH